MTSFQKVLRQVKEYSVGRHLYFVVFLFFLIIQLLPVTNIIIQSSSFRHTCLWSGPYDITPGRLKSYMPNNSYTVYYVIRFYYLKITYFKYKLYIHTQEVLIILKITIDKMFKSNFEKLLGRYSFICINKLFQS